MHDFTLGDNYHMHYTGQQSISCRVRILNLQVWIVHVMFAQNEILDTIKTLSIKEVNMTLSSGNL